LLLIFSGPVLLYWRDAWWPDAIGTFSLSIYLQNLAFEFIFFTAFALTLGVENRINVDPKGISLKRFGHVVEFIGWEELEKVYRSNKKIELIVVFESKDRVKKIPIYYSSTKHFKIIYEVCQDEKIRNMLEDLKFLK